MMAVFDGVRYSLSSSLSPTRRNELTAVLDLNGAAPHPPYTHLIAPAASHAHNDATKETAMKLVTDRWVDRSVVMGKRQPEQYYSPDPAMIFSGVVACATDLSAADLEVLSAGITALGGQWRVGLTRDVTHLFALRTGSDKYNTALHFAPQTHMCILTPHWFDDAVRLGRRIPETPYAWPDPPVLRPGMTLDLDDDPLGPDGKRKRKLQGDADAATVDGSNIGEHVRVWEDRRILLSASLELTDGSRRAIEARIQRAGGVVVPISEGADEDAEEKAVDQADVFITRWRSGRSYFKAARASLLVGTLSWLFSVESSGTLYSPFDSLLWYPTPRGGIPDLIDCEISVTNYTGAARDYLKRLITLIGAKFTPSMSQTNKVLVAGFQPSPKTTRALSWSIPVVNHTWLEDCFVEWRALTVGLERYIVYPPGVDFGKMLMTRQDGPSSQSGPTQRLSGGAIPGGRGIGTVDIEQEEARDTEYRARAHGALALSTSHEAFEKATTADEMSMIEGDILTESRARPHSRAGSVRKTPSSARLKRGSASTPVTGAFVDHVIELPADDDDTTGQWRTPAKGKQPVQTTSESARPILSRLSLVGSANEVDAMKGSKAKGRPRDGMEKDKGKGKAKNDNRRLARSVEDAEDEDPLQSLGPPKLKLRPVHHRLDVQSGQSSDEIKHGETSEPRQRRAAKTTVGSDFDPTSDIGEKSDVSVPPRRPAVTGSATPVKSGMKPRPRSESQSRARSVLGMESEKEERVVTSGAATRSSKRPEEAKPTRNSAKVKVKDRTNERKETKTLAPRPRSPTRSQSPIPKSSRTPKRRLSVVVPSVPKDYFSSQDVRKAEGGSEDEREKGERGADAATSRTKRKPLAAAMSMEAVAAEASTTTSKRGKPSSAKVSVAVAVPQKSKPLPLTKTKPKAGTSKATAKAREDDTSEGEGDGDVSMVIDTPRTSTNRGPRRSAANKATTRLREEIMPDVVSFEKEQKQAKRRRSTGGESVVSVREDEEEREERGVKKRKLVMNVEQEEEAEVEGAILPSSVGIKPKPKPINGKGKTKASTAVGSDEDTDDLPGKHRTNGSQEKKGARGRGKEPAGVRLLTTGVNLSDDVIKRLTKLGAQMTTKPTDCTHLVAKGIVRTEKFLCAMSVSPYILTEEWANASAKSSKLLPEADYLLSDPTAEQKWAFEFADAMARAKGPEGGPNLFRQMTFYVTPKVSVDTKLLKNIISAGGGQVQTSTTPTVRILKGKANRFVISCQEDKAIWRPLAQEGFNIYSPELVLRGTLRQEIEWEKEECLVMA